MRASPSLAIVPEVKYLLAAIPVAMLTLAIPLVNRTEPRVFGLPFLVAWIVVWIALTPAFMSAVARLDRMHERSR